jgi:hypothetical protein
MPPIRLGVARDTWLGLWEMIPMDNNRRPLGQMCGISEAEALVLALEAAP